MGFEIIASSEVAPVAFDMTETAVPIGFCGHFDQDQRKWAIENYKFEMNFFLCPFWTYGGGIGLFVGF